MAVARVVRCDDAGGTGSGSARELTLTIYTNESAARLDLVARHLGWPQPVTSRRLDEVLFLPSDASATIVARLESRAAIEQVIDRYVAPLRSAAAERRVEVVLVNLSSAMISDKPFLGTVHDTLDAVGLPGDKLTIITRNLILLHWYDARFAERADRVRFHLDTPLPGGPPSVEPLASEVPDARLTFAGALGRPHAVLLAASLLEEGLRPGVDYGTASPLTVSDVVKASVENNKERRNQRMPQLVERLENALQALPDRERAPLAVPGPVVVCDETATYASNLNVPDSVRNAIGARLPFLIHGGPHTLRLIRALGFETFAPLIDEAYDDVLEPGLRQELLQAEIVRLMRLDAERFAALMVALEQRLTHNEAHLKALLSAPHRVPGSLPAAPSAEAREAAGLRLSRSLREEVTHSLFSVPARLVPAYVRTADNLAARPKAPRPPERVRIGVVSHLASSGGTAISKCIGTMGGVTLLSEVHPFASMAVAAMNPLYQYQRWFGLDETLGAEVAALADQGDATFADVIEVLAIDANRRGTTLVLRDWSHVDYVRGGGLPPSAHPRLIEALAPRMEISRLVTTRHPLDIWLSLLSSGFAAPGALADVMRGMRQFAQYAHQSGYLTYEAFTETPDDWLQEATRRLDVPFDPGWADTWGSYTKITGDSGRRSNAIAPRPRRPVSESMRAGVEANADYRLACELLGYA